MNLGLKLHIEKNGIEGKTSTVKRIKFTLEPNEERDAKYLSELKRKPKATKKSYSSTRNKSYKDHGVGRRTESSTNELANESF